MYILKEHKEILLTQSESKTLPEEWLIYIHTNKINGKVYIGQTKRNIKIRSGKNGNGYKKCPYFYKAIQKYGWDNFSHDILEEHISSQQEANEREKYWIQYYDANNPSKGYNIDSGGGTSIEQLKCAWAGSRKWREENPEKFQSSIEKMRQVRIKQCSIAVFCVELKQNFYSAGEAARQTGADQSGITKCCKGKQKTAGGYHWKYAK